MQENMKIAL